MAFQLKQHDTRPIYIAQLMENVGLQNESPIDLTDAAAVHFLMRGKGVEIEDVPKVNRPATIVTAVDGIVSYSWQPSDTDTIGEYNVEFEIIWSDGGRETVPNEGFNEVVVGLDLGDTP